MARGRKKEWTFGEGVIGTAAELRIPYSRLYNELPIIGLKTITCEDDLKRIAVQLQQGAISFSNLIKIFGREITLGQLAALEEKSLTEPRPEVQATA